MLHPLNFVVGGVSMLFQCFLIVRYLIFQIISLNQKLLQTLVKLCRYSNYATKNLSAITIHCLEYIVEWLFRRNKIEFEKVIEYNANLENEMIKCVSSIIYSIDEFDTGKFYYIDDM